MENNHRYITVSALNKYIAYKFEVDNNLKTIYLKAEISNIRISKGIMYFVLKDEESEIDGIMFSSDLNRLNFNPCDGMVVLATGRVVVYAKRGRYSINVTNLSEAGLGAAYLNFLSLKDKLSKEGLFDQKLKLPLPKMSEKIGVITSDTGDALHDIVSTVQNRFPIAQIYLYPAQVQGINAAKDLIRALKQAIKENKVDVIIIGRGGGSVEDLSCFNDESLAREIVHSPIPIVSAVGHEADYTICDFVASFRAPTPTGAAVIVTKAKWEIITELDNTMRHISNIFKQIIENKHNSFNNIMSEIHLNSPINNIKRQIQKVEDFSHRIKLLNLENKIDNLNNDINKTMLNINKIYINYINSLDNNINEKIDKLVLLNPLNLMKKGYAIVYKDDTVISSVKKVNNKDTISIRFVDGVIKADVKNKEEIL